MCLKICHYSARTPCTAKAPGQLTQQCILQLTTTQPLLRVVGSTDVYRLTFCKGDVMLNIVARFGTVQDVQFSLSLHALWTNCKLVQNPEHVCQRFNSTQTSPP